MENNENISKAYENTMKSDGNDKWHDRHSTATDVTEQLPEFRQLQQVLDKVTNGLKKDIETARASTGRRPEWLKTILHINPETLAYLGLHACYNAVLSGKGVSSLTQEIGRLIDRECLKFDLVEGEDAETNKDNKRIIKMVSKTQSSPEVRLKSIRNITTKNGFNSLWFGINKDHGGKRLNLRRKSSNASPVLSAVLEHCNIFEKKTDTISKTSRKSCLVFTAEAELELERSTDHMSWQEPMLKPIPMASPAPWTSFDTGCYADKFLASTVKLVRNATRKQMNAIEHQFTKGEPMYVTALNALQATPLSINEDMLEVVKWCWESKQSFGKFPKHKAPLFPRLPENYKEVLDEETIAAIKSDQRDQIKTVSEIKGTTAVMRQDLQTATELAVHDWFTIPWNLDTRGRFNCVPAFNYHRADHIKSLFQFYRGYKVHGNNSYWLKVHLANCCDFEKISKKTLDARCSWVNDNRDLLLGIANDYKGTVETWSKAATPLQFVAACMGYKRFIEEGEDFVGYLPYAMDGTNSGVQHYSAASLSYDEGYLCNLVPSASPQDIYQNVADKVVVALNAVVDNDHHYKPVKSGHSRERAHRWLATVPKEPDDVQKAKTWLKFGLDRKNLKKAVMVFPYSSKATGMTKQYVEDLMKPFQKEVAYGNLKEHPIAKTEKERFFAARYLADVSYAAIVKTLPSASLAMDYLQAVASVVCKQGKALQWNTPSGFPICSDYQKSDQLKTQIFLYDRKVGSRTRSKVTFRLDSGKVDVRKSLAATPANFTHGNDAAAMALTIVNLKDNHGIQDFFMIHDSFAVSGDVGQLYTAVRESFIDMYSGRCVFQDFKDDLSKLLDNPTDFDLPENNVPPIPPKGNLDLKEIMNSEFCFS